MLRLQCQGCKHVSQHPIKVSFKSLLIYKFLMLVRLLVLIFACFAEVQAFWDRWRQEGQGNFSFLSNFVYLCFSSDLYFCFSRLFTSKSLKFTMQVFLLISVVFVIIWLNLLAFSLQWCLSFMFLFDYFVFKSALVKCCDFCSTLFFLLTSSDIHKIL